MSLIDGFGGRRVLVVGDLIADEFIYGDVHRVSREAPVLILKYDATEIVAGGAGNAANNVAALGGTAALAGMVGADDATFAELKPVLAAFCENIIHAGPAGHGIVLKLINNFIAQAIATATAEALAAAAKAGLSIRKLHELISAGAVNSGIFQMMVGKMLEGNGDLTGLKFTLVNAMKDMRYYTHFAESLPVSAIIGEAVHQSLVNANLMGFGDKYVASLIEAQEKLNGIRIVPRG